MVKSRAIKFSCPLFVREFFMLDELDAPAPIAYSIKQKVRDQT